MRNSKFKRVLSLLMLLALCMATLSIVAYAADPDPTVINPAATGSITVTKYANTNSTALKGTATGTSVDQSGIDSSYTTLKDAEFVLVKIYDKDKVMEYYNGNADSLVLDTTKLVKDGTGWKYNGNTVAGGDVKTGKTDASGVLTFGSLPVGIYILREITAPDQITTPLAEDSLISIPMVNTAFSSNNDNKKWIYDVNVYPKNHEATGTVELTKVDQNGNGLNGVTFKLSKKEFKSDGTLPTGDWENVVSTVDNNGVTTALNLVTANNGTYDGIMTLANLPAGLYGTQYKLEEVSAPEGYIVNQKPLYFKVKTDNSIEWNAASGDPTSLNNTNTGVTAAAVTAGPKLSITLRNELPDLTKKVFVNGTDFSAATDLTANWKEDEQYRLDDTITYSLIAYVPNNVSEITYEITDLPDLGITDSQTWTEYTVTYADSKTALTDGTADTQLVYGTGYTLSSYNESGTGQGFTLTLTAAGKTETAGKFIQIVYKAHMNSNAVIAGNGNGNTATLTYSKYIGSSDTTTYAITDEARVYTYQYQITKYKDSVDDANKLAVGETVEFQLLDASKNPMKVFKLADGKYRLAITGDVLPADPYTMVTRSDSTPLNSTLLIQGLENGTYYLKETKTIKGYNLLSEPFKITVSVGESTTWNPGSGFNVVKTYGSTSYDVTDAMGTSTIINKKGFVLPQTGGMGYLLFSAAGIILIAGGTMLLMSGRKKRIR